MFIALGGSSRFEYARYRTAVQKQTNEQLFFVDQKGDEHGERKQFSII